MCYCVAKEGGGYCGVCCVFDDVCAHHTAEARRLAAGGGVYVNGDRVDKAGASMPLLLEQFQDGQVASVRVGKKKHAVVVLSS